MNPDQATYEAYDGVRITLLDGTVVECEPLTVAEAVRFLRQLRDVRSSEPGAHEAFTSEFPARIGITGESLTALGLEVEHPSGGSLDLAGLTYSDAVDICEQIAVASWHDDVRVRSDAQIAVLDEFPSRFGLDGLSPPELFAVGQSFAKEFYLLIYGLAQDFCSHLTASPPVRNLELRAPSRPKRASTT